MHTLFFRAKKVHDWIENLKSSNVKAIEFFCCIFIILSAIVYHMHSNHIYKYSNGFTISSYLYQTNNPENFKNSHPVGTEAYKTSSLMQFQKIIHDTFDISSESITNIFIALEIILLFASGYFMTKYFIPNAPSITCISVSILLIASSARDFNLARYATPHFNGQFYTLVDVIHVCALIYFLKNRLILSSILLGILFTVHPSCFLYSSIFIGSIFITNLKKYFKPSTLWGFFIFSIIAGTWAYCIYYSSYTFMEKIPYKTWVDYAKFGNVHFFPWLLGQLWYEEHLYPFLCFFALFVTYYIRDFKNDEIAKANMVGAAAILLSICMHFALIGFLQSSILAKLSLPRASSLITLVGTPYVVNGLIKNIKKKDIISQILTVTLFISFFHDPYPMLITILLIITSVLSDKYSYLTNKVNIPFGKNFISILLCIIFSYYTYDRYKIIYQNPSNVIDHEFKSKRNLQIWIRKHLPKHYLVMHSPDESFSLQDSAGQASFGKARDWLHNSFLYAESKNTFEKGMEKLNEFSINITTYIKNNGDSLPINRHNKLTKKLGEKYHNMDMVWFNRMSKKYDIRYFIFRKKDLLSKIDYKKIYENDYYIIYEVTK